MVGLEEGLPSATTAGTCGPRAQPLAYKKQGPPSKILKSVVDICLVAEASSRRDRFF